jgi:hypothetical protein
LLLNKNAKPKGFFNIESANILCDKVVKLLGIDIDYQLNFDKYIKNICRKASQQLSVLKRNLSGLACLQLILSHLIKIELSFSKTLIKVL